MTRVSFLWSGCPGVYGRRVLTGDVLETKTTRRGSVEYLVKAAELNLPKWVSAHEVTVVKQQAAMTAEGVIAA